MGYVQSTVFIPQRYAPRPLLSPTQYPSCQYSPFPQRLGPACPSPWLTPSPDYIAPVWPAPGRLTRELIRRRGPLEKGILFCMRIFFLAKNPIFQRPGPGRKTTSRWKSPWPTKKIGPAVHKAYICVKSFGYDTRNIGGSGVGIEGAADAGRGLGGIGSARKRGPTKNLAVHFDRSGKPHR